MEYMKMSPETGEKAETPPPPSQDLQQKSRLTEGLFDSVMSQLSSEGLLCLSGTNTMVGDGVWVQLETFSGHWDDPVLKSWTHHLLAS